MMTVLFLMFFSDDVSFYVFYDHEDNEDKTAVAVDNIADVHQSVKRNEEGYDQADYGQNDGDDQGNDGQ